MTLELTPTQMLLLYGLCENMEDRIDDNIRTGMNADSDEIIQELNDIKSKIYVQLEKLENEFNGN